MFFNIIALIIITISFPAYSMDQKKNDADSKKATRETRTTIKDIILWKEDNKRTYLLLPPKTPKSLTRQSSSPSLSLEKKMREAILRNDETETTQFLSCSISPNITISIQDATGKQQLQPIISYIITTDCSYYLPMAVFLLFNGAQVSHEQIELLMGQAIALGYNEYIPYLNKYYGYPSRGLITATQYSNFGAAKFFLKNGALITYKDSYSNTATDFAIAARHEMLITLCLKYLKKIAERATACASAPASPATAAAPIEAVPADYKDEFQKIFYYACAWGKKKLVESTIDYVSDLNGYDAQGKTPLMLVAQEGFCDIAHFLVEYARKRSIPIKLDQCTRKRETAIILAAKDNNFDMIELLKKLKANPSLADAYGNTYENYLCNETLYAIRKRDK